MSLLERAIEIALESHHGQTDRYGSPYILHPLLVMMHMDNDNEMMAAVLHDVLEDSNLTLEFLRDQGFPAEVLEAVRLLTHDAETFSYSEYVRRLKLNPIAAKVKLADLKHNMDIRRMDHVEEKDAIRLEKYRRAWETLAR